ncbi:hypothetical protein ACIRU3_02050 [Streptomyces sp. NPDC101151]|uniref:hypothetical protein n=1 Tax=Streptomyces sp. NPDC101151 TaxID=3366115 RepID=UPI00381364F5
MPEPIILRQSSLPVGSARLGAPSTTTPPPDEQQRRDLVRSDVVDPVMKKTSALAALTMAGLALATPAHADNGGDFGRGINVAGYRHFSTADLCKQALALVPVAAPWTGQDVDDACNNRDHTDRADHTHD